MLQLRPEARMCAGDMLKLACLQNSCRQAEKIGIEIKQQQSPPAEEISPSISSQTPKEKGISPGTLLAVSSVALHTISNI